MESLESMRARWVGLDSAAGRCAAMEPLRALLREAIEAARACGVEVESDEEVALEPVGADGDEDGEGERRAGHVLPVLTARFPPVLVEGNVDALDPREWQVPPQCIPIHANVTTYNWSPLASACQFDVVMMDPPWQLATANPTRGVSLGYSQLTDDFIGNLPLSRLQTRGLLFVWVINAKYQWTLGQFKRWGYTFVDEIVWVKVTNSRRLAKSHGFYLQHAKEVCLVAHKGEPLPGLAAGVGSDVIMTQRRGQSQKPTEIYDLIERLVPNGRYLEIFARKNNLRDYWVSVGNEVSGTGLPDEDNAAIAAGSGIPNAKFGASNR